MHRVSKWWGQAVWLNHSVLVPVYKGGIIGQRRPAAWSTTHSGERVAELEFKSRSLCPYCSPTLYEIQPSNPAPPCTQLCLTSVPLLLLFHLPGTAFPSPRSLLGSLCWCSKTRVVTSPLCSHNPLDLTLLDISLVILGQCPRQLNLLNLKNVKTFIFWNIILKKLPK